MKPIRVACFIDGFNLYHAVDDLNKNHLKWLDLKGLASAFIVPSIETLTTVNYFSAYATWKPDKFARHKIYVSALEAIGVDVILGKFKEKPRECLACGQRWIGHEEKETDVRIAIHLVAGALKKIRQGSFSFCRFRFSPSSRNGASNCPGNANSPIGTPRPKKQITGSAKCGNLSSKN